MPIHDWSRVEPNLFHHFHQAWTLTICNALNNSALPKGYSALIEQHAPLLIPDVLTVEGIDDDLSSGPQGGAVLTAPPLPKTRHIIRAQLDSMSARGNRIAIHHSLGNIVCVIEIMSPGNKHSQKSISDFIDKAIEFLDRGVNLLIVDLFPPTSRDPQGIHKAIWDQIEETPFDFDPLKPLTLAAYIADLPKTALIEPVAVGDALPDMPAYLDNRRYVYVPLESTYEVTWKSCPAAMRKVVEKP
jgi:Protein of unknown function (DUF4058)